MLCGFNGDIVHNNKCDHSNKPNARKPCNQIPCPEAMAHDAPPVARASSTHWRVSTWSHCSTSCGLGHRTRTVQCSNYAASTSECENNQKPVSVEECNQGACPRWNYGQWTPVSRIFLLFIRLNPFFQGKKIFLWQLTKLSLVISFPDILCEISVLNVHQYIHW